MVKLNYTTPYYAFIVTAIVIYTLLCQNCNTSNSNHEYSDINIRRLDKALVNPEYSDSTFVITSYSELIKTLYPSALDDNMTYRQMASALYTTSIYKAFASKIDSAYHDTDYIRKELTAPINNYANFIGATTLPQIITVITPFNQSIMIINDSVAAIGINHYLGQEETLYQYFPEHIRKYKHPGRIKYDTIEALLRSNISYNTPQASAIQKMIYEGTIIVAITAIVPDADINEILEWNNDEANFVKRNSQQIWNEIIGKDLLYSSSQQVINELTEPIAYPYCLNESTPALIGRYYGYMIVSSYLKASGKDASYNDLCEVQALSPQQVLLKSRFNGK